jgi:hypothetical protein
MEYCKSSKIDVIIFDWTNPSFGEILMVKPDTVNPFYHMINGNAQAVLTFGEDGKMTMDTPDGGQMTSEEMEKKGKEMDMRNAWMAMIADECEREGVVPPPFFIVHSRAEHQDIAKILSQKLGNPIT